MNSKKILILLGPTGVGKTALSIFLAKILSTEIISSDSMQIYKHMDIGTAKPTEEERAVIRHHMIDIIEPWCFYSVGEYIKAVQQIIDKLLKEGKTPIIVGGTGLYIRAMTKGLFKGPSADWDLRQDFIKKERKTPGYLYDLLIKLDPLYALKIMPTDIRRIVRALEVCLKAGRPFSELQKLSTTPLPYDFIKIGLYRDRKELYSLINERVDKMIKKGLVDEVKRIIDLISRHCKSASNLSSMQAIGYKEIAMYLNKEISYDDAIRLIKKRSRNYAKRQFAWFKNEKDIRWIDVTGILNPEDIFMKLSKELDLDMLKTGVL